MKKPRPKIRLEPLEERHAEALFEGLKAEAIYRFIDEKPPDSLAALRERCRRLQQRRSPDGSETWLNWAIWSLSGERYVGYVQATIRPDGSAWIAYVIFPDVWRNGFATEAVSMMMKDLVEAYETSEFRATVDRRNGASIALLRKLGFKAADERNGDTADLFFHLRACRP